jgi:hypothetical protein
MTSKPPASRRRAPQSRAVERRLVVTAERRNDPDWDRYVAALLVLALRRVEAGEHGEAPKEERG